MKQNVLKMIIKRKKENLGMMIKELKIKRSKIVSLINHKALKPIKMIYKSLKQSV